MLSAVKSCKICEGFLKILDKIVLNVIFCSKYCMTVHVCVVYVSSDVGVGCGSKVHESRWRRLCSPQPHACKHISYA